MQAYRKTLNSCVFGLSVLMGLLVSSPSRADDRDVREEAVAEGGGLTDGLEEDAGQEDRSVLGLMLDAGVPDGANLAVVWRPEHWLRFHVGGGHNLNSPGVRAGVSLMLLDGDFTPSLVVEGGHYFAGDLGATMESVLGIDGTNAPDKLSYSYGNAHLGLEFGGSDFTFYLRGGYSLIEADLRPSSEGQGENFRFDEDVHLTVWAPSAKLGFVIYIL